MKRYFYMIILFFAVGFLFPTKSFAHLPWNRNYWSGTLAYTGYYLAFGWPTYSLYTQTLGYSSASLYETAARNQVEFAYRIMEMGEGKKQVWLEEKMLPQPIIPAPVPPENLEAPDIVVPPE